MPFSPAEHSVHHFDRELSRSDTGRAIYGCTHPRCPETETRGVNERSPYAAARAASAIKKAEKKRDSARRGGA